MSPSLRRGPVLVFVEYLIEAKHEDDFIKAMRELRQERLRDGAMRWGLFGDPAHPRRYIETFLVESWLEHMRQHERVTQSDRQAQEVVRAFYIDDKPPEVSHFIHVN